MAVPEPDESPPRVDRGIKWREALLSQARAARAAIERHDPDRIVTLGGDCLVDLAPIAYLSRKYGETLGVLWVDAHPDVMSATEFSHAHAHVLAMLLGRGACQADGLARDDRRDARMERGRRPDPERIGYPAHARCRDN